jgi:hypothetical protein
MNRLVLIRVKAINDAFGLEIIKECMIINSTKEHYER